VSLRKLGIEQLDLWLLHQPLPSDFERTIAAYKAAEKLLAEGRVRAIGVSNQTPKQLDELISRTDIVPAVNQIQVHPWTPSSPPWPTSTRRHPRRSCCAGISTTASARSPSPSRPIASPRTSTSSTSPCPPDEVAAIDALDTGVRGGPEPEQITRETFGLEIPEA
jgi:hypothetical protein